MQVSVQPRESRIHIALDKVGFARALNAHDDNNLGLFAWWLHAWHGPVPSDPTSRKLIALLVVMAVVSNHFRLRILPRWDVGMENAVHFAASRMNMNSGKPKVRISGGPDS